ncbi:MAG: hypothetical protein KME16_14065 [Scytolyngbya sp. HA4215-MV1]|nr:hypothetical protein [Scytolyngbya sp. HA4215-MV1]
MKAYEFPAHITTDGKLELPAAELPRSLNNQAVRVIVLISETENSSEQTDLGRPHHYSIPGRL